MDTTSSSIKSSSCWDSHTTPKHQWMLLAPPYQGFHIDTHSCTWDFLPPCTSRCTTSACNTTSVVPFSPPHQGTLLFQIWCIPPPFFLSIVDTPPSHSYPFWTAYQLYCRWRLGVRMMNNPTNSLIVYLCYLLSHEETN